MTEEFNSLEILDLKDIAKLKYDLERLAENSYNLNRIGEINSYDLNRAANLDHYKLNNITNENTHNIVKSDDISYNLMFLLTLINFILIFVLSTKLG